MAQAGSVYQAAYKSALTHIKAVFKIIDEAMGTRSNGNLPFFLRRSTVLVVVDDDDE